MIKKEYQKPEMNTVTIQHRTQILIASLTNVSASGLDSEESLDYGDDDKKSINSWEAW